MCWERKRFEKKKVSITRPQLRSEKLRQVTKKWKPRTQVGVRRIGEEARKMETQQTLVAPPNVSWW